MVGTSGIQRTLRFAQYLPEFGWRPVVLTASVGAFEPTDPASLGEIPPGCEVVRAPCFDAARHLSIRGRYPAAFALPDRWASWRVAAGLIGAHAARRFGARALFSTYPIATAHLVGDAVARRTGLPWIADFRDPMAQQGYPADQRTWRAFKAVEECVVARAAALTFASPSACRMYQARYPRAAARCRTIENGYDESSFAGIAGRGRRDAGVGGTVVGTAAGMAASTAAGSGPLVLLHSGIVYPSERDPSALFRALASLAAEGAVRPQALRLRFRAPVHDALIRALAARHGVAEFVEILPAMPYRDALQEMADADGLLVLQGASCNEQIPAKLYEYLRAGRPVLGLADPAGDTGSTMRAAGVRRVAALEDADSIAGVLVDFLADLRDGSATGPGLEAVRGMSRRERTRQLATLLDAVVHTNT